MASRTVLSDSLRLTHESAPGSIARRWCIYTVHACQVSWHARTRSRRLLSVSSTLSRVSSTVCRGFHTREPFTDHRARFSSRVVSRHFRLICLSYLTPFRRASRISAQHILRQRLVARHHRLARTLIYDRHSGRCEQSSAWVGPLEIWHGSHVFTTRFSLLRPCRSKTGGGREGYECARTFCDSVL